MFTQKNKRAQERQVEAPTPFQVWLFMHKKQQVWVAELLGISSAQVSRIISADSCIESHRETLLAAGVPENSLPKLSCNTVGRPPKSRLEHQAGASAG